MQIATTIGVVFPGIMHSIVILILLPLLFKIKQQKRQILCLHSCVFTADQSDVQVNLLFRPFSRPISLQQLEWKTSLSFISYSLKQKGEKMSANQIAACVKDTFVAFDHKEAGF